MDHTDAMAEASKTTTDTNHEAAPDCAASAGYLAVTGGHRLYFEQFGDAGGLPAVFLHGGPGSGCRPSQRALFDPGCYRAVLFDQRGAGRSRPAGGTADNTTPHLIGDLEHLRRHLGIERWVVVGGSWGATLALAYAQTHPDRVAAMVLRGTFLARPEDLQWFFGPYGAARLFPWEYARFRSALAVAAHQDPIGAYSHALTGADQARRSQAARAWSDWENCVMSNGASAPTDAGAADDTVLVQRAAIACHYAAHQFFLGACGALFAPQRLGDIPGHIIHGARDLVCPLANAWALHQVWSRSELRVLPDCGHGLEEPGIANAVAAALDATATRFGH